MRRKGFTLIELLVVIAIIGILAAMLFPVFARARESARKAQCLTNVKNLALAINMYLVDYDPAGPIMPYGQDSRINFATIGFCNIASSYKRANPYLREPVVLDDYIKDRDIWRCPSAKVMDGARQIVPMGRDGLWWNAWKDNYTTINDGNMEVSPCNRSFPPGWGGDITDSIVQDMLAQVMLGGGAKTKAGTSVFLQGIGCNDYMHFTRYNDIQDPAKFIVLGDVGNWLCLWEGRSAAFPDRWTTLCQCGGVSTGLMDADPTNCPWSATCGLTGEQKVKAMTDSNFQKILTRHMGGSNLGFLDGHARWYPAKVILTQVNQDWSGFNGPDMTNNCTEPLLYGFASNYSGWH